MSNMRNILAKQLSGVNGTSPYLKIPENKRPTAESIKIFHRSVSMKINENNSTQEKSLQKAKQTSR